MKFVISKQDLERASEQASTALHDDERDMVLTHFLVEAVGSEGGSGAKMRMFASNRATVCMSEVSIRRIDEPGRCTIPGHVIAKLAHKAPDADITIESTPEGKVLISGGPSDGIHFKLQSLDPTDFGESFEDFQKSDRLRSGKEYYLTAHFLNHVLRAKRFVGDDDSRPAQMVMTLRDGNFLAGDGKVFHCAKTNLKDLTRTLSIPGPVTSGLLRYIKSLKSEKVDFKVTDSFFYITPSADPDRGYFGFIRQDVDWPEVEQGILPLMEAEAPEISVDRPSLLAALERLELVLPPAQVGVALKFNKSDKKSTVTLLALDSRGNDSQESIQCQWTGETQTEYYFNIVQLISVLRLSSDPICRMKVLEGKMLMGVFSEDLPDGEKLVMSVTRVQKLVEEQVALDDGVDADGKSVTKGKVSKKSGSGSAPNRPEVDEEAVNAAISSLEGDEASV